MAPARPEDCRSRAKFQILEPGNVKAHSWLTFYKSFTEFPRPKYPTTLFRDYSLYFTTNLSSPAWSPVTGQNNILGDGGTDILTDTNLSASSGRYYRVAVSLP